MVGRITYLPGTKDKIDVTTVSKDKIIINGVEYEQIDLEEHFIRDLLKNSLRKNVFLIGNL